MNRFIIADATKCIGCRTCEVACAVSHHENQDCAALSPDEFISRIRVIKDHCWTTAVACHQCEDAPCANVCPVDAISREHGHIFVEQTRMSTRILKLVNHITRISLSWLLLQIAAKGNRWLLIRGCDIHRNNG